MRNTTIKLLLFIFIANISQVFGQHTCLFDTQDKLDPKDIHLNEHINSRTGALYVPVVFHIIQDVSAKKIKERDVLVQLASLNADFSALNEDFENIPTLFESVVGASSIHFELANIDPEGLPTSGIKHYKSTALNSIDDIESKIKAAYSWNTDDYINVYVLNIPKAKIKGYAFAPTPKILGTSTDGIVIDTKSFGTRTLTHEMGHYFGLNHPWGTVNSCNGDDGISDTPPCAIPNFDCRLGEVRECGQSPMFMNFMDYAPTSCALMFTVGQVELMEIVLKYSRSRLLANGQKNHLLIKNNLDPAKEPYTIDFNTDNVSDWAPNARSLSPTIHTPIFKFKANTGYLLYFDAAQPIQSMGVGLGTIVDFDLTRYFKVQSKTVNQRVYYKLIPLFSFESSIIFKSALFNLKTFHISKTVSLTFDAEAPASKVNIDVSPTVTSNSIRIRAETSGLFDVNIIGYTGMQALSIEKTTIEELELNLQHLTKGIYVVVIRRADNIVHAQKIMKY